MFYALAHNQQKILDKVNLFAALAPVTRITNSGKFPGGTTTACEIRETMGKIGGVWDLYPPAETHGILRLADRMSSHDLWFKNWFMKQIGHHNEYDNPDYV